MNFNNFFEVLEGFKEFLLEDGKKHPGMYDMHFPKIRDTFISYLKNQFEENKFQSINEFLRVMITAKDIKKCVIDDVKRIYSNQGYASVAAVNNFFISINQFFFYLEMNNITNTNILILFSGSKIQKKAVANLKAEIINELSQDGIILREPKKDPAVSEDEVNYILDYLRRSETKWELLNLSKLYDYNKMQYIIIIELFLLLGLKTHKMYDIKMQSYDENYKKLYISSEINNNESYAIVLPDILHDQIKFFKKHRTKSAKIYSEYLFARSKGQKINEGFLPHFLKKICFEYISEKGKDVADYMDGYNSFTPTGLMKYGIIKMMEKGVNSYVIRDITGVEKNIYQDCEKVVFEQLNDNSTYFNTKVIDIDIYKKLSKT